MNQLLRWGKILYSCYSRASAYNYGLLQHASTRIESANTEGNTLSWGSFPMWFSSSLSLSLHCSSMSSFVSLAFFPSFVYLNTTLAGVLLYMRHTCPINFYVWLSPSSPLVSSLFFVSALHCLFYLASIFVEYSSDRHLFEKVSILWFITGDLPAL